MNQQTKSGNVATDKPIQSLLIYLHAPLGQLEVSVSAYTGNSVTYTSSTSPSWTVDLNLYGNRHPTYQNSHVSLITVNPLTPIDLYANYSEYFTGVPVNENGTTLTLVE